MMLRSAMIDGSWRNLPPTEKQLQSDLKDQSPYEFCGNTREDACDFINKALNEIYARNELELSARGLDIYDN